MNNIPQEPASPSEEQPAEIEIILDVAPGGRIQLDIETHRDGQTEVRQGNLSPLSARPAAPTRRERSYPGLHKLNLRAFSPAALFGAAMAVYLLTRLIAITQYPVYFFCDEAINTVLAADLVRDGFQSYDNELLPTFFKNGPLYCLNTSVYVQVVPYLLFGKSLLVTRAVPAILTLLAALWLGFMLRDHFKIQLWQLAPLVLAVIPTWFLHSRTAFEYSLMVTFYTGFLYYYLNYRAGKLRDLYLALILGALAFYSYSSGEIVIVVTGLALLLIDFRYHQRNRVTTLRGFGLLTLLVLPLVRFWLAHPQEYATRLVRYSSYLASDTPVLEKISRYLTEYLSGLNPIYWFFTNPNGEPFHQMAGHAHIAMLLLPFYLWGIWLAAHRLQRAEMRVALVALLAAPCGAALVAINPNRALAVVIPVVLLAMLGMAAAIDLLSKRAHLPQKLLTWVLALALTVGSFGLLADALTREPLRSNTYGLKGLQFGAKEIFGAAATYREDHPDLQVLITPNWAFQAEVLRQFFVSTDNNIRLYGMNQLVESIAPEVGQSVFVLLQEEYDAVVDSGHFDPPQVEQVIQYPDGSPGFYFVRLRYRSDIQAVLQTEQEARARLVDNSAVINGETVIVRHQELEGEVGNLFDGDPDSLIKTRSVNPLVIELVYDTPRPLTGIVAWIGSEKVNLKVSGWEEESKPAREVQQTIEEDGRMYRDIKVDFGGSWTVRKLRFELYDVDSVENSIVHLWELEPLAAE